MNKTKIWALGIAIVMVLMLTTVLGIASAVDLKAGQTIGVGSVTVSNSGTDLFVKYETTDDWVLSETHLAVKTTLGEIPQNKGGNPIPGKFEYKTDHSPSTTTYTYVIPLGAWKVGETLFVAAHAVVQRLDESGEVVQEETAWGDGDTFTEKNWAMYFKYTVQQGTM